MMPLAYRAWIIREKEMVNVTRLWMPEDGICVGTSNESRTIGVNYYDKRYNDEFILMQAVGKQDINDNNVFVDDLLQFPGDSTSIFRVMWDIGAATFTVYWYDKTHNTWHDHSTAGMLSLMKVVGNIYENKELLA